MIWPLFFAEYQNLISTLPTYWSPSGGWKKELCRKLHNLISSLFSFNSPHGPTSKVRNMKLGSKNLPFRRFRLLSFCHPSGFLGASLSRAWNISKLQSKPSSPFFGRRKPHFCLCSQTRLFPAHSDSSLSASPSFLPVEDFCVGIPPHSPVGLPDRVHIQFNTAMFIVHCTLYRWSVICLLLIVRPFSLPPASPLSGRRGYPGRKCPEKIILVAYSINR